MVRGRLSQMEFRLDEIDRRIIYRLSQDARNTPASDIADEMGVSPGTVRNRIKKLEDRGIIRGYHADIDYEKAGNRFVTFFKSSSSIYNRGELARKALQVPRVINVYELLTGEMDLYIKAVANNTGDISKIARKLHELGIEIEDEDIVQRDHFSSYEPFCPEEEEKEPIIDFRRLAGTAETVDLTVEKYSQVVGKTLKEIKKENLIDPDSLLIAIERDNETFTPKGDTEVKPGDIVTLFSTKRISEQTLQTFGSEKSEK